MAAKTILLLVLILVFALAVTACVIMLRSHRDDKYYDDRWHLYHGEEKS